MKILGLITAFGMVVVPCLAQEQETTLDNHWTVKYDLNDSKKLNGPYAVYDKDKVILRGSYNDGERKGNWFSFTNDGKVFARYNYDTNQLVEMDQDEITNAIITVKAPSDEIAKNARISFPIVSIDYFVDYMKELIKHTVPSQYRTKDQVLPVEITVRIDKEGEAKYQATYIANTREYMPKLKINEKLLDIDWIPAEYKGEKYESEFKVYTKLTFEDAADHKRVIWN